MTTSEYFSQDYYQARTRFREAVARRGGRVESLPIRATGPHGDALTIDVAWFGAAHPTRVMVHSCGLHGIEGFAGSAIQLYWLAHGLPEIPADGAVAIVHVINPWGMIWLRRVNQNNVDLNRNFRAPDDDRSDLNGDAYMQFDPVLNPPSPPRRALVPFQLRVAWMLLRYGWRRLAQTVGEGQCVQPKGVFYVGTSTENEVAVYEEYIASTLAAANRIVAIDVHTGLGEYAVNRVLIDGENEGKPVNEVLRATFGKRIQIMSAKDLGYRPKGGHFDLYSRRLAHADCYFAGEEIGTHSKARMMAAFRGENQWHFWGDGTVNHPAKEEFREIFCPKADDWRAPILQSGLDVAQQACALAF